MLLMCCITNCKGTLFFSKMHFNCVLFEHANIRTAAEFSLRPKKELTDPFRVSVSFGASL